MYAINHLTHLLLQLRYYYYRKQNENYVTLIGNNPGDDISKGTGLYDGEDDNIYISKLDLYLAK